MNFTTNLIENNLSKFLCSWIKVFSGSILCLLLAAALTTCGGGIDESNSGAGAIAFSIKWPERLESSMKPGDGLQASIPVPDPTIRWDADIVLPDDEQLRAKVDSGCRFYPRCVHKMDHCLAANPALYQIDDDHLAACYLYDDLPVAFASQTAGVKVT